MASDRPPHRRLVKLGLTLALGRGRAHWQDHWPGLALEDGAIVWRGRRIGALAPFARLAQRAGAAAEVAIVGSGPTLAVQNLAALPAAEAILLNGAVSLVPRIGAPLAVAVEDERFVWRHHAMLRAAVPEGTLCLFSVAAIRALAALDAAWLAAREIVLLDNIVKPYHKRRRTAADPRLAPLLRRRGDAAISLAPDAGVVVVGTVAFSALQAALALRPRRIGLAGVELSGPAPRFYESEGDVAHSGLDRASARILPAFALAAEVAAERGIRLECWAPGSRLLEIGYPFIPRLA